MLDFLATSPGALAACVFVLGLMVGSFLNVVIHRLPALIEREWRAQCAELLELPDRAPQAGEPFNLMVPRSHCPACGHRIGALENIPVASYLWLGGRCSACGTRISPRYPIVELASAALAAVVVWQLGWSAAAVAGVLLTWTLIPVAVIDYDHQIIPDAITLPGLWLGLLCNLFGALASIESAVIGAAAGYGVLWLVYHGFRLMTGKEGMGYGDFKLLALLGAWLGWQALPVIVLLASFVGAAVGIALIVLGRHERTKPIPFGPYLAVAGWVALLWGGDLVDWYLG